MISEELKCIFVHNPKTGGTSIKNHLHSIGKFSKMEWHYDIEKLCNFATGSVADYFKFATCRNPYERLVSAFVYNCRNCANPSDYHWKSYPDSYAILKKWVSFDNGDLVNNFRYFVSSEDFDKIFDQRWPIHFRQQYRFFTPKHVDHVIRFENLNDDYKKALEKIGHTTTDELPTINSSNHIDYRKFYDIQTMNIVNTKYREDFNIFEYNSLFLG